MVLPCQGLYLPLVVALGGNAMGELALASQLGQPKLFSN